jgi:hypothetical protein
MKASARPRLARAFLSIVLILFGVALAVSACVRQTKTAGQAGEQTPVPPSATATTPSPTSSAPSVSPTSPTVTSPPSGNTSARRPPALLPRLPGPYLPLWPFADGQQVRAWETAYLSGGHQPWHLSAQQTALAFARGYLHYTEIDRVTGTTISGAQARVAVGHRIPDGGRLGTAAVVHLVRFGAGRYAPWEVVGTDDTTFSLTRPAYGAHVASTRMVVGGRITGVDESIRIQVRRLPSGALLGGYCCVSAGDQNQPWSATVTVRGASHGVLTIAAATGGHLFAVERFTVTGIVR